MVFAENLAQIQARGHHYLVVGRPGERLDHLEAFDDVNGVHRAPSPRNPAQRKTRVEAGADLERPERLVSNARATL